MKRELFFLWMLIFLFLTSCGKKNGGSGNLAVNVKSASVVANQVGSLNGIEFFSGRDFMLASTGQASPTTLQSLQYILTQISLCQSLTANGSGFSNKSGCVDVITSPPPTAFNYTPSNDYSNLATVARANTSNFTDLMSASARAALAHTVSITQAGAYKWQVTTWVPVVAFTADVTMGSTTLRTADGSAAKDSFNNYHTTSTTNFSTASSDSLAYVLSNNGGTYSAMAQPFTIAQADIDSNTAFAVDLTFDPDGFVRGSTSGVCSNCELQDGNGNAFHIPAMQLLPILHKATDTVSKEVYQATITNAGNNSDNFDLRLTVYYITGDTTKAAQAVDARILANTNTTTNLPDAPKPFFVVANQDGSLNFQDWSQTAFISNLKRISTVGQTTTATFNCAAGSSGASPVTFTGCGKASSDPTSVALTLTLKSVAQLQ